MSALLSHAGRWMLNRRDFLRWGGTGLGGIALASLLGEQGLLASETNPIRPGIDPARPNAPRPSHFAAKARRVLMIFCSGGLGPPHTFDFKPELSKRHDTPMPGKGNFISFQGENGNLI